ncbi:MAG: RNA 2',3'-cyclic phosphodiesterase [Gallicola sp.]|nr:RNA 2',3'-cyclic phosphodiesterase [Gallicola sp.]
MRLFIAVELSQDTKNKLHRLQKNLKGYINSGNFIPKNNLHLTLKFLGDCTKEEKNKIIETLSVQTFARPFTMDIVKIGTFSNRKAKILWAGVEKNPALVKLVSDIEQSLSELSFKKEQREYKAHITLARKIIWKEKIKKEIETISEPVSSFVLYESLFTKSGVQYKEIFRFYLR